MTLNSKRLTRARRYALLLVDLSIGFTDPERSPLASESDAVVAANRELLDLFRQHNWPVIYTTVAYDAPEQSSVFREKLPVLNELAVGSGLEDIDPRLQPGDGEAVIVKHAASGFFGTDLDQRLQALDVDGVIVTGLTTSGCVRATAVDALQYNYRVVVPREAVGDRDLRAHYANLRDLGIKYADVLSLAETRELLTT